MKKHVFFLTAAALWMMAACDEAFTEVVTGVVCSESELVLSPGQSGALVAFIIPKDAADKRVTWKSSDPQVALVDDDGRVTAVGPGTAIITTTTKDGGQQANCTVKVIISVKGLYVTPNTLELTEGESSDPLVVVFDPADATETEVEWKSSDEDVATVSDGVVTARSPGTATITVKTVDGQKWGTCEVTVNMLIIAVTGIEFEVVKGPPLVVAGGITTLTLSEDDKATLAATVKPDHATWKEVEWRSSDETIVSVSDGIVTPVAVGEATITVTAVGGITATLKVIITAKVIVTDIVLAVSNEQLLTAQWTKITDATGYKIHITDMADAPIITLDVNDGTETSYDLGAYFTANPHAGKVKARVEVVGVTAISNEVTFHPLFDNDSGDGTSGSEYLIGNLRHLQNITPAFWDRHFKQIANINFTGVTHAPLGVAATPFTGSYDGGNYSISNFVFNVNSDATSFYGFIGVMEAGGMLKNLKFENSAMTITVAGLSDPQGFGFAVGANRGGTVENVHTVNCSFALASAYTGNGSSTGSGNAIGNIVGSNNASSAGSATCLIRGCTTTGGEIRSANTANGAQNYIVGGILGAGYLASGSRVENCANMGTHITTRGYSGGIAGQNSSVVNCHNTANIDAAISIGGILGFFNLGSSNHVVIERCYNSGKLSYTIGNALFYMGGILARTNGSSSVTIRECFNLGTIDKPNANGPNGRNIYGGGILGCVSNASATVTIENCFNAGDLSEYQMNNASNIGYMAGILGVVTVANPNVSITSCYHAGSIVQGGGTGTVRLAGIMLAGPATVGSAEPNPAVTVTGTYYLSGKGVTEAISYVSAASTMTDTPTGGKTATELLNQASYGSSWDFTNIWFPPSGTAYPALRNNPMSF